MTNAVISGTTRYLCPLECGWHHDEPPFEPSDAVGIVPDPAATDLQGAISSIAEQVGYRRAETVESAVREHVATHGITTVEELRAAIAAIQPASESGT